MNTQARPKRRWFRYSLRSFLLLLTALCVWLGFTAEKAVRQKRAVEAILAAGGMAHFDGKMVLNREIQKQSSDAATTGPAWARSIVGNEFFRTLIGAGVTTDRGDEFVANLAKLAPDLKLLQVNGLANFSDRSLVHIAKMDRLESLNLICPELTLESLPSLKPLTRLTTITILHDPNSWESLRNLENDTPPIDCEEFPLSEVITHFQDVSRLPIAIDSDLAKTAEEILITAAKKNVKLKIALREILEAHNLGYYAQGNIIFVATTKTCEEKRPGYRALREMFPNAEIETDW